MCHYGHGVVRKLFEEIDAKTLKGFSVWLPVMDGDKEESARAESENFPDERVEHGWDSEGQIGQLFAIALNLKGVAWDVHLLYEPGITWEADDPPKPTFWMHQLPPVAGADGKLQLNPGRFSHELMNLLGREDAHIAWDLAFMLHAEGIGEVMRERAQASLEEVLEAVDPRKEGT